MAATHDDQYSELQLEAEQNESPIAPGANLGFFAWLALLGIPALLLFLIMQKNMHQPQTMPVAPLTESGYSAPH